MNTWTRGDDAAVCLSYCDHGVKPTRELLAALSHLPPGSVGMRLQNVEYLATGGARGLSATAAQTREIWALVSAARDAAAVPPVAREGPGPPPTAWRQAAALPLSTRRTCQRSASLVSSPCTRPSCVS